jgi:hypothetical protein
MAEHLPSKCKALCSNPNTTKKANKKTKTNHTSLITNSYYCASNPLVLATSTQLIPPEPGWPKSQSRTAYEDLPSWAHACCSHEKLVVSTNDPSLHHPWPWAMCPPRQEAFWGVTVFTRLVNRGGACTNLEIN